MITLSRSVNWVSLSWRRLDVSSLHFVARYGLASICKLPLTTDSHPTGSHPMSIRGLGMDAVREARKEAVAVKHNQAAVVKVLPDAKVDVGMSISGTGQHY